MNKSITFLSEIDNLFNQEIPRNVILRARKSFIDYLAVTCAGAEFNKEKIKNYINCIPPESGDYTVLNCKKKLPIKEAIFLNGLNAHSLDYDDGTNAGIIHLGAPIFSILVSLSEYSNSDFLEFLKCAIIGYEVSFTLANSIQPTHKLMGYHATGTCGIIGATIAACYFLKFSQEEIFNSFGAACVSSSGMLKVLDGKSEMKPLNVAKAAMLALNCVQLGKAGFKGPDDPLGGRGFFKMMVGSEDMNIRPFKEGGIYSIMKTYTKPYASCRYTHPAIEAVIFLKNKYNIRIEDISEIEVSTYSLAVAGHNHTDIKGASSAKMSIPYSVAIGLVKGKVDLEEFQELVINNVDVINLTKKVKVSVDDNYTKMFPQKQGARVEIETLEGTRYVKSVDFPKGEPENPLNEDEFMNRYNSLMNYSKVSSDNFLLVYNKIKEGNVSVKEILEFLK